ncbi:hypothetical protein BCV72DRAFT_190970, partial [Rhizopus microsporus var. microsporus]
PVEGITEEHFLDEEQVLQIIAAYLPDDVVNKDQLTEWMAKDEPWAYRDYRWDNLHNVHQLRHVRLTNDTIFNMGYIRRSNTQDT